MSYHAHVLHIHLTHDSFISWYPDGYSIIRKNRHYDLLTSKELYVSQYYICIICMPIFMHISTCILYIYMGRGRKWTSISGRFWTSIVFGRIRVSNSSMCVVFVFDRLWRIYTCIRIFSHHLLGFPNFDSFLLVALRAWSPVEKPQDDHLGWFFFWRYLLMIYIPGTCLSPFFGFQQRRPFPINARVIWVPRNINWFTKILSINDRRNSFCGWFSFV